MQKQQQLETAQQTGRKSERSAVSHQASMAAKESSIHEGVSLEQMLSSESMKRAWKQVKRNKGAAGIDGMTIEQAKPYLQQHWEEIRESLLEGDYHPQPVRRVDIPKPGGGERMLGVPTVLDRLLQQAMAQLLTPVFDPTFSESSYGFRPKRSAHQAVRAAREYISQGRNWVVDLDLSKFFDRVNHDILMSKIVRRVHDKRLLKLISSWLTAGIMSNGIKQARTEGTPQGGPLSPLLANILLDGMDKRLEEAGHNFCRYADDCNVYVQSERAGQRVMTWMREYLEDSLKLKVNETKSAVDRPEKRSFLGFTFERGKRKVKTRIAKKSWERFQGRVRTTTKRGQGCSLESVIQRLNRYLQGWKGYYRLAETRSTMQQIDAWIRRRLRCFILKQWKRPKTRANELRKLGGKESWSIISSKGLWRLSKSRATHSGLNNKFFKERGLYTLSEAGT
jgi:RNA-directed DNA polymerase